ncbi:MAG: molybdopterin converting factor subunit 1 [Proteobacteria bacterium]|jgi:molybdopterin synthase sulfur carrier subunit|nr:molybdopterin converting factor subunit 1 [Pseudomonadota bacterium]MDA1134945.1 molybdopterin converting factor subunit 1 [Pseudomonadota bacterium]
MIIKYFSWIREHVGKSEEEINLPESVITIDDLINYLISVNEVYKIAFLKRDLIKIAVNKSYSSAGTKINDKDEIAFFPPVTGG